MKQAPHLVFASDSTSGDFLASRVIQAYQNISPENLEEISTLYTPPTSTLKIRHQEFRARPLLWLILPRRSRSWSDALFSFTALSPTGQIFFWRGP